MKETKSGVYTRNNEAYNFNFVTDLSTADKLKFVDSVVNLLVDDKHYNSVIRDLVFDFYVVDIFTNIDTAEFKDSIDFLNDVEQFLDETNIVEIVKINASTAVFDELNKAVDNSIAYLTGIHPNPLNEAISNLVNTIEKKINEVDLDSMMSMAKLFTGMTEDFTLENVVNAYMESDVHKKNLEEIAENKRNKIEMAESLDKAIKTVNDEIKSKSKKNSKK